MIRPLDNYDEIIHTNALTMFDEKRLNPIPTNIILNKLLTGWGATYCEIRYNRNSIILLPHKTQIFSKHAFHCENDNTFPVTEKQTVKNLESHIRNSNGRPIKFLSTPEGLFKVIKAILGTGGNPYTDYFLLIDECHKITKDVNYRVNISTAMNDFFLFKNKSMISATPFRPSDPRFETFKMIKVEHEVEIRKDITLFRVNNLGAAFKEYLINYDGELLFVFFNTLNGIYSLLENNELLNEANVYCSEDGVKDLALKGIQNAFSAIEVKNLTKVNLLTSSFFNGLDISGLPALADILILTDITVAEHTIIDPNTDTYQILGRFRKKDPHIEQKILYRSATHIVNTRYNTIVKSQEKAMDDFITSKKNYFVVKDLQATLTDPVLRDEIFEETLKRIKPYANLLDDDGHFDNFKYDNYLYEYKLKGCYGEYWSIATAYDLSGLFNVKKKKKIYLPEEFEKMTKKIKRYSKENIIWVCDMLVANENQQGTDGAKEFYTELQKRFPLVVQAAERIGYQAIHKLKYSRAKIEEVLLYLDIKEGKTHHGMIDAVYNSFLLGRGYEVSIARTMLQKIFDDFGIKAIAKSTDIKTYFTVSEYTGHRILTKKEGGDGKLKKSVRMYKVLERKFNNKNSYSTRTLRNFN
jgi:hypothetical protein